MEVWSIGLNKTRFLSSSNDVNTTVLMHQMDADKMYREKKMETAEECY